MCLFVAVAVKASKELVARAFDAERFRVHEAANPGLRALAPAGADVFYVTAGGCSCGLEPMPLGDSDKLRRKYEKKGWSKNKIDRAIAQAVGEHSVKETPGSAAFRASVCRLADVEDVHVFAMICDASPDDQELPGSIARVELSAIDAKSRPFEGLQHKVTIVRRAPTPLP
jgi:hypothetical protein